MLSPLRARKSNNFRERAKQRTDTKKDAKRIKSDNFTRSNWEKSLILLSQYRKNEWLDGKIIISYFGGVIIFSPTVCTMDNESLKVYYL